jgi:secondary thiamine-phosphate synthase enzyme
VIFRDMTVSTQSRVELLDITRSVEEFIQVNDVDAGLCLISSPHTTTAIIVNEREAGLMQDILKKVGEEFPRGAGWLHDKVDDNADAHLAAVFIGSSKTLPVRGGRLVRGTWQSIFLLELDGPRSRTVLLEFIGDK